MLHQLQKPSNSTKNRKRVGRGQGAYGKTCGRGNKGQGARAGSKKRVGFEGGQMPIYMRLPKRGFHNKFAVKYQIVSLESIEKSKKIDKTKKISIESLKVAGLIKKNIPVKILGRYNLSGGLQIEAHKISKQANESIQSSGGNFSLIK